jgi:hypothetical protein
VRIIVFACVYIRKMFKNNHLAKKVRIYMEVSEDSAD